jgi:hypothetical protein
MPTFAQSLYLQDGAALAARANDAQVSLNLINTFGARQSDGIEILQNEFLTEQTGGRYTGVTTAQVALRQIDDATRHGYLIGYAPTNGTFDGKYRRIEVRVPGRDVQVIVRQGYFAAGS